MREKEVFLLLQPKEKQVCLHRTEFQFFVTFTTSVNRHVARTRSQVFQKKAVLKNLVKYTEKYLY